MKSKPVFYRYLLKDNFPQERASFENFIIFKDSWLYTSTKIDLKSFSEFVTEEIVHDEKLPENNVKSIESKKEEKIEKESIENKSQSKKEKKEKKFNFFDNKITNNIENT